MDANANPSNGKRDERDAEAPPFWEWVSAAIGAVLVAACIAYLTWHAFFVEQTPPRPEVTVAQVQAQGERWLVTLRAHNHGRATASALRVSAALKQGAQTLEEAETEFQHLPGESSREAGVFFARDPRLLRVEVRVKSYQKP